MHRSVDPPSSRRRSGRRRARDRTDRRRCGGATREFQKSPSLYCRRGKETLQGAFLSLCRHLDYIYFSTVFP
jgi:hypothetical protein